MSITISDINDAMLNRQADRIKELEQERDQLREPAQAQKPAQSFEDLESDVPF